MYTEKYKTIKDFIDWCVENDRIEWMGYYNADHEVLKDYFDAQNKIHNSSLKKSCNNCIYGVDGCQHEPPCIDGKWEFYRNA